jgi:hypothetical protein
MSIRALAAFAAILFAFVSTSAEARHRYHHQHYARHHVRVHHVHVARTTFTYRSGDEDSQFERPRHYRQRMAGGDQIVGHPSGCPYHAFCGCGVSVKVFGHPVRELYLAANWFRFPRAAPAPGMIAVRFGGHHVMYIIAYDGNGNATVYDPNSGGHQTRIHQRSLSGYSVRDPHGARMASR